MRSQRGASLAVVVLALAILVAVLLAIRSVARTSDREDDRESTVAVIVKAQTALEAFAALNHRLPCPANPAANTGEEDPVAVDPLHPPAGSKACTDLAGLGTLPWKALGLRSEDALDAWGMKISYVPYTGIPSSLQTAATNLNAGSLTQAEGVNMTNCDTVTVGQVDNNGLCKADHSTGQDRFLQEPQYGTKGLGSLLGGILGGLGLGVLPANELKGKGKRVQEPNIPERQDAAYVLVSHGSTGLGAFDRNGAQRLPMPAPKELDNSPGHEYQNAIPVPNVMTNQVFYKDPFSNLDVGGTAQGHFDDIVIFITVRDLVNHIGLPARQWAVTGQVAAAVFNDTTLSAALGRPVTPGTLGTQNVTVSGVSAGTLTGGQTLGLGTVTTAAGDLQGIGITSGATNATLSSATISVFGLQFPQDVRTVGLTLAGFDGNLLTVRERVRFTFYDAALHQIGGQPIVVACNANGYTTLNVTPTTSGNFRFVQIEPIKAVNILGLQSGDSAFLLSEAVACDSSATACPTPIARSDSSTGCP